MRAKKDQAWAESEAGRRAYREAREKAQAEANADGFDRGIERNDLFKSFRVFMLPARLNRYGFEVRCEVVSSEDLRKCQPGHGPGAR